MCTLLKIRASQHVISRSIYFKLALTRFSTSLRSRTRLISQPLYYMYLQYCPTVQCRFYLLYILCYAGNYGFFFSHRSAVTLNYVFCLLWSSLKTVSRCRWFGFLYLIPRRTFLFQRTMSSLSIRRVLSFFTLGASVVLFHLQFILNRNSCKQTVYTLNAAFCSVWSVSTLFAYMGR